MACLFCGKEIGPFRLLRDKEFCCSDHRQGYSARLGKALGRISEHQPPPAPIAPFIPYKPFPGTNRTLSNHCTLEPFRPTVQYLNSWPLAVVPLPRERTAPLPLLARSLAAVTEFSAEPQPWPSDKSVSPLSTDLTVDDAVSVFAAEAEREPEPAEAAIVAPVAADWPAESTIEPDQSWTVPDVRLPETGAPAQPRSFAICAAAPSLLAEAVEAFLPLSPEPEMLAFGTMPAVRLHWSLEPIDWEVVAEPAPAAPVAAAEPVESFLPPFAEPQIAAWPAAVAAPQLEIAAADWMVATALADPVAGLAAEPVESFLPGPAEPQIAVWPAPAALPQMAIAAADWTVATGVADPVAGPAAQPVESFLPAPAEPQIAAWPARAPELSRLSLSPKAWVLSVDLAGPVAAPAAQAVESLLPASPEPQMAAWPAPAASSPSLALTAIDWELSAWPAEAVASPAAEAVESLLPVPAEPVALPMFSGSVMLPELGLAAIEPEPVEEFVPPLVIADACQEWMTSPPACEVEREVSPTFGAALPCAAALSTLPLNLELALPEIRWEGDWRPSATAEPVIAYVAPHFEPAIAASVSVSAPRIGALQKIASRRPQNLAAAFAEPYPNAIEPAAPGSPVLAGLAASATQALRVPGFSVQHASGNRTAAFRSAVPTPVEPAASELNRGTGTPLEGTSSVLPLDSPAPVLRCGLPLADPATGDFICQRAPMAPIKSLQPVAIKAGIASPKFVVRPIFERVEEAATPAAKPVRKTPAFAEIFTITRAARRSSATRTGLFSAGKLIAASLIVGLGMWFGAGSVKISRQMFAINTFRANPSSGFDTTSSGPSSFPTPKYTAKSESPIAKVRHAIQNRASVEFTDTFRRMEAWGSSAMELPAGWTRNADGYVRTGQLALFRPAQSFSDYHFEFYGEIEKKSMDWAVRAKDSKNYYGMKMAVIEPGLRPVVAMVHYAVVDGKKGQRIETPLSMMVHNNEPYHVAVDIKGNHVVTSIEGQQVDSWTDDALKSGGVGFFSELGESARLYWMRVSKNQDWLGRVCAYLSSGSGSNTADLWREEIPHAPSQPFTPAPPATDLAMAAEDTEDFSGVSPQRARISKYGRTELCRS